MVRIFSVLTLCASILFFVGCESSDVSDNVWTGETSSDEQGESTQTNKNNEAIAGTWSLTDENNLTWYIHFNLDGTWKITNDASGVENRVHGTYEFDGSAFSGPMVNPNVGEGKIEGTISGTSITLSFIEYWHTPHKTVGYTGSKQ